VRFQFSRELEITNFYAALAAMWFAQALIVANLGRLFCNAQTVILTTE
jgi:hypothetical protein